MAPEDIERKFAELEQQVKENGNGKKHWSDIGWNVIKTLFVLAATALAIWAWTQTREIAACPAGLKAVRDSLNIEISQRALADSLIISRLTNLDNRDSLMVARQGMILKILGWKRGG